jgi:hypothetical protein
LRWLLDLVIYRYPKPRWFDPIDPWRNLDERGEVDELPEFVELEWLAEAALGGAVMAMREQLFPLNERKFEGVNDDVLERLTNVGAEAALRVAGGTLRAGVKALNGLADLLNEGNRPPRRTGRKGKET